MSNSIEFLRQLAERLQTQDNALTASPNYCIQEHRLIAGIDEDYGGEIGWFDDENGAQAKGEEAEKLEAEYDETGNVPDGWIRCGYKYEWEYTGTNFLTHAEAHAYVSGQGRRRHMNEIRVYVDSHCYNAEMREVRRLLAGPVVDCIEALQELLDMDISYQRGRKVREAEEKAIAALAALDTAKEPHQ